MKIFTTKIQQKYTVITQYSQTVSSWLKTSRLILFSSSIRSYPSRVKRIFQEWDQLANKDDSKQITLNLKNDVK